MDYDDIDPIGMIKEVLAIVGATALLVLVAAFVIAWMT